MRALRPLVIVEEQIARFDSHGFANTFDSAASETMYEDFPIASSHGKRRFAILVIWASRDPSFTTLVHAIEFG